MSTRFVLGLENNTGRQGAVQEERAHRLVQTGGQKFNSPKTVVVSGINLPLASPVTACVKNA